MTSPERTARVLHGALLFATLLVGTVVTVVGVRVLPAVTETLPRTLLRTVVIVMVLFGTVALRIVRATLDAPTQPDERASWWTANTGRLVALWAVSEGVGIAGVVLAVVARDMVVAILVLGWAVVMLLMHAPGRVVEA
jgi:hypothetical protein